METASGSPERLVGRLISHLKRHRLWDSLLLFIPPFLVFSSLAIFLYSSAWVAWGSLIFVSAAVLGMALLLCLWRFRAAAPSLRTAARLIDERVEGKERFVTLATVDPSVCPSSLLARLRHEAAGLLHRLDLDRDFPYRAKRSFFQSLIGSLSAILLFLLFLQIASFFAPPAPRDNELALLAQKLSQIPRFAELARSLETLALRFRESALTSAEQRSLIQEVLKKLASRLVAEQQLGGTASDLLNQAAGALRELEQGLEGNQQRGAGGRKEQLSGEGEGDGKETGKGMREEKQGELSGVGGKELKEGRPERGEKQAAGKQQAEKDQGKSESDGKGREKSGEVKGMGKEEREGKGSRNVGEEIPRGKPAERFLAPGEEGEKRIKGARFVTVQLPEEETESKAGQGGPGNRGKIRPKVPVSNVPLQRPDTPEASPEKQHLPLEYRGLIR